MNNLIIQYERDIRLIDFLLKIRAAPAEEKLKLYRAQNSTDLQTVNQRYWSFSEADLSDLKIQLESELENFLSGIDITNLTHGN